MKSRVIAAVGVLGLGLVAGCSSGATDDATNSGGFTAYVTDAADNGSAPGAGTVIPVNLTAQTPGTPIALGPAAGTNDIIVTADGKTGYVSNEGTDSVTSIDLASGELGTSIPVGYEPVDIEFVPQTNEEWAWVANYGGQTITTVNLATGTAGETLDVPAFGPNTVAFTPDGRTCYVAYWGTDDKPGDTVTPILVNEDGSPGEILPAIAVGLHPNWIAITDDGATAYVANKGSNSITPIDVTTNTAGEPIEVPGPPIQMEISPDGTVAYVAIAGESPDVDEIAPIDLTTSPVSVGPSIKLPVGTQPHWIGFTPDGSTAYVVGNGSGTLTPIDVASGALGTPIQVSSDPASDLLAIAITGDQ